MIINAFATQTAKSPLEPFSYPEPELKPFEVLIEITHCGLCHSDIHLIDNDWNRSTYPLVPGHEVIGVIVKKGSAVSKNLGERVGVSWLYSACLECPTCLAGDTNLCPDKKATCIGHYGGFASHMTADSRFIYRIPEALSSEHAAPLLCAGATVYTPFRKFKIQAPDKVAILGIGGLGHLALQFGKAFGCHVTAISSSLSKKQEALSFGASDFITLEEINASHALQFDYILSTAPSHTSWDLICSLLKPTGLLCLLGRTSGPFTIDVLQSLSSGRTITVSSVANRLHLQEMLEFAAQKQVKPQIELMKMSQINEAIKKVRNNQARYRIVLSR